MRRLTVELSRRRERDVAERESDHAGSRTEDRPAYAGRLQRVVRPLTGRVLLASPQRVRSGRKQRLRDASEFVRALSINQWWFSFALSVTIRLKEEVQEHPLLLWRGCRQLILLLIRIIAMHHDHL
jgi:hypothetical protein